MKVESKKINVHHHQTGSVFGGDVLITAGEIASTEPVLVTVGAVGCQNIRKTCTAGDFINYEPNENEVYEVRPIGIEYYTSATFLVSRILASEIFGKLSRLQEISIWAKPIRLDNQKEKFTSEEIKFLKEKLALFQTTLNS